MQSYIELQMRMFIFENNIMRLIKSTFVVSVLNMLANAYWPFALFQISEVVNSMKDLIDYSRETRTGPIGK